MLMTEKILIKLADEASQLAIEETGLLALDWLNGRRSPFADQTLKGAIVGLTLGTSAAKIFRALVEATAFGARAINEQFIQYGVDIKKVIATGGIAKKSDFVMQVTADVLNNRMTFLNLRNAVDALLELGVIPIFNENDSVSTEEIGSAFGDNDRLSALVASKVDADLLIMLTDIDGLYTHDPRKFPEARIISTVHEINREIIDAAGSAGSAFSTGGMRTKIEAAKVASLSGCPVVLANGRAENILHRIICGEMVGTLFVAGEKPAARVR